MTSRKAFLSRNINDAVIFNPEHDEVLTFNSVSGVWINKPAAAIFSDLYLTGQASDIGDYHKLVADPDGGSEVEDQVNVASASGLVLIQAFATDDAFETTLLRAGSWHFITWAKVDNVGGDTDIVTKVYTRTTGGSETLIATIFSEIDSTTLIQLEVDVFIPDTVVNETDRLVVKYYAQTTSTPSRVVTMTHDGEDHYTHMHLPFGIGSSGGTSLFTGLTDTPANYTAASGLYLRINDDEDAVIFDSISGSMFDHGDLTGLADDDHEQYLLADGSRNADHLTVGDGTSIPSIITTAATADFQLFTLRGRAPATLSGYIIISSVTDVLYTAGVNITAKCGLGDTLTSIVLRSDSTVEPATLFEVTATKINFIDQEGFNQVDFNIDGGLSVGAVESTPPTGDIWAAADVRIGSGLFVGGVGTSAATGEIETTGNITIGDGTGSKFIAIDGAAGDQRQLYFRSGGSLRWVIRGASNAAESGSNVGSDFEIIGRADNGTYLNTPIKIFRSTGNVLLGGSTDLYSVPWTNYFGSSTIVGWDVGTYTTSQLYYKKVGKLVFVQFNIQGTSNSTITSFTVPFASKSGGVNPRCTFVVRNNSINDFGNLGITSGASVASCRIGAGTTPNWTALGLKQIHGSFVYEAA